MRNWKNKPLLVLTVVFAAALLISAAPGQTKKLRHVVLVKFKDGTTDDQIKVVENAFRKLPTQLFQIKSFEWGVNNSPEKLNDGFTHCFFLTFNSEKDRDDYLNAPAHKTFVEILSPVMDKPLVVDYWVKN